MNTPRVILSLDIPRYVWVGLTVAALLIGWASVLAVDEWAAEREHRRSHQHP